MPDLASQAKRHLAGMQPAVAYTFFDHELARFMRDQGWIYSAQGGSWFLTSEGIAEKEGLN